MIEEKIITGGKAAEILMNGGQIQEGIKVAEEIVIPAGMKLGDIRILGATGNIFVDAYATAGDIHVRSSGVVGDIYVRGSVGNIFVDTYATAGSIDIDGIAGNINVAGTATAETIHITYRHI